MTVSTQANSLSYTGNGVTTAFSTGYPFVSNDSLIVTLIRIATGERSQLIEGVGYSVAGAGVPAGGTITTLADIALAMVTLPIPANPISAAFQLEIRRSTPAVQPLNLVANDGFDAEATESALDRVTMTLIDLNSRIADVLAGVPSSLAIINGDASGFDASDAIALYSGITGTTHKLRQVILLGTPLKVRYTNSEQVALQYNGLLDGGNGFTDTPDNSGFGFGAQLKAASLLLALWDTSQAANATRWAFASGGANQMSLYTVTDDLGTFDELLQFTRSGATAVSTKLMKKLDANGQRILSVQTIDYNDVNLGNSGTTKTVDWTAGNFQYISMTGNCTFTFTAPSKSCVLHLILTQSSGGHTMALPAAVKWTAATSAGDKLLSTGASKRDLLILRYDAVSGHYLAQLNKDW